jgi:lipopolysaccharide assembly outer membrane protein LptD (OstA)
VRPALQRGYLPEATAPIRIVSAAMKNCIFLVLLASALGSSGTALSQERFDISADNLLGTKTGSSETVVLEGNVRILHGTTLATADSGIYDRTGETVRLVGNVEVKDGEVVISGERARYLRRSRQVIFARGIEIRDTSATLAADRGTYRLDDEVLDAEGHVVYGEGTRSLRADRVTYSRATGFVRAAGAVCMEDDEHSAVLRAEEVTYSREEGFGLAVGAPWLEILDRDGKGGMDITADSMELYVDRREVVAIGDVNILREKIHAEAGRAVFLENENKTVLTEGPRVTEGLNSIAGETITVFTKDGEISQAIVSGAARSVYEPPDGERTEFTGDVVEMNFVEGEMSQMVVRGGADGIFYPAGTDTMAQSVRNEVQGSDITLVFEEGEAKTATVSGGVKGVHNLSAAAGEADIVNYASDSLYYDVPSAVMHLEGGADVEYAGMKLHSGAIEYNADTYNLYATESPVLWEGDDKITGSSLSYNLKTRRGAIATGRTAYEGGLYTGEVIRKTGEQVLNVSGGMYTTCDYLDPHYSFTSSAMKVYINDKVIARPVIMRVRGVPVFALPFFMFPIKRGRHSGILLPRVELGFYQDRGRFVRNVGYYWAPSDYFDVSIWGDFYEDNRSIAYLETRYRKRYLLDGEFDGSYSYDIDSRHTRWDLGGTHTQNVGEQGRLILHADFVSDATYRRDTSEDLEKALRRELDSDISYSGKFGQNTFSIAAERSKNLDTDQVTQALPRFSLLMGKMTLIEPSENPEGWHRGTYLSGRASGSATLTGTSDNRKSRQQAQVNLSLDSDFRFQERSQNLRSTTLITTQRKAVSEWCSLCEGDKWLNSALSNQTDFIAKFLPFGWLNLNPSVTTSLTLYDDDKEGNRFPVRFMYWGGLSSTASIFRTYFPRLGPLQAIRHVVTPRVSYTYRPDFGKYEGRFYSLPGVSGEVGKASSASISLENRLQAKVTAGGETRKINNLLSLETSTSYDFLYRERGKETPLSTINNSLRFYPVSHLNLDVGFSNNPRDLSLESLDLQTSFNYAGSRGLLPGFIEPEIPKPEEAPEEGVNEVGDKPPTTKPWDIGLIYRYTKAFDGGQDSYWLDLETGFNLTSNWRVEYSGRFDLSEKQTAYQEFSVYRDLHCWEARFVRRESQGLWQYYFRVNIKVHPEIYAERGLRALYRNY